MKQLVMVRQNAPYTERPLPDGYSYVGYHECEEQKKMWLDIIYSDSPLPEDGGAECYRLSITDYPDVDPDKDIFFVVDTNGERVATTTVVKHADNSGYVHMVHAKPSCRGKGIGHCLATHAVRLLAERDVTYMLLTTDDWRIPAIKTYLDAGFRPVIVEDPESDMTARWDAIIEQLHYGKVNYLHENDYL